MYDTNSEGQNSKRDGRTGGQLNIVESSYGDYAP